MGNPGQQASAVITADHACWKCGYNLRGLTPVGQCPECGQPIDLTRRLQRSRWRYVAAFLASLALVILACGTLFLDSLFAVTVHFKFILAVELIAAIVALPVWYWTRSRVVLVVFAALTIMLLVLPFVSLSPRKPYLRFYKHVRNGMTQQRVLGQLDRYFPKRASDGRPSISPQRPERLSMVLDPYDGRYNSEQIIIYFEDDGVVAKKYLMD